MTKKYFEMAQKACGIGFNPHGLLADKTLRNSFKPLDMHTEDWSHVYLCHGVGGDELAHLMRRLKRCGVGYETFREEIKLWKFPKRYHGTMKGAWRLFSDTRAAAAQKEDGSWKSSASELLTIIPIVLDWICRYMSDQLPGEVESFRRFCEVIDYIQGLKHQIQHDVHELQRRVVRHLHQHALVYGKEHWTPKWHATLHLTAQIIRDGGIVLDTLANERDHQVPKSYGDIIKNLDHFEEYVLKRSLAHQINELKTYEERLSLVGAATWSEDLGASTAAGMSIDGVHIAIGDFVRTPAGDIVEVKLCGLVGTNLFLLGDACELLDRSETSLVARRQHDLRLVWVRCFTDVSTVRCWKPFDRVLRMVV